MSTPNDRAPGTSPHSAPGEPVIPFVNWGGMQALYVKEVRRFFKVQLQTVWAPAFTSLLLLVVFTVALGSGKRMVLGHPFADFIAPGMIIMAMMNAAFAHSSFTFLAGKMQGTIVDYLMPPISNLELMVALVGSAVTRALCVGLAVWGVMALLPGVHVTVREPLAVLWFGLMGSLLLAFLGTLTSIWADKFDHAAAITNFIVQPMSLLSGTFYSVDALHGAFRTASHLNPFFYVISGFRYGFLGTSDSPLMTGALALLGVNLVLGFLCYRLLVSGWKLRA
ncbi:ABC transporter permease [Sphingomonas naphthae]|uniref:Transport permease protein n=1 Tax=Sphingomonas naphthae TaxID=1813468 RepID=A0ABY7TGR3_9SPHN|nr:ABC transporter permease [Sphingomonas naphthae]WCT72350.1 ABC transporter permease [Sphingomonas naphthae]